MTDLRKPLAKVLATVAFAVLIGVLAVQFMRLVRPAAAREIQTACANMNASPSNPVLGALGDQAPMAPEFAAQDHNGNIVNLADFRGKVVLVNFWATWCDVCAAEKPSLEAMTRALSGDDFVVLTLASNESWDAIRQAYPNGLDTRVLIDPPVEGETIGRVASRYGVKAVPESFVIDKTGRIRYYFINKRNWASSIAQTCLQAVIDE